MNDQFFLNEVEMDVANSIADNDTAVRVLEKILLAAVYSNGTLRKGVKADPMRNAAFSLVLKKPDVDNETLGADLRALAQGTQLVALGIEQLKKFKSNSTPREEAAIKNPAR